MKKTKPKKIPAVLSVAEARLLFGELLHLALAEGRTTVVTRFGRPVAQIGPVKP